MKTQLQLNMSPQYYQLKLITSLNRETTVTTQIKGRLIHIHRFRGWMSVKHIVNLVWYTAQPMVCVSLQTNNHSFRLAILYYHCSQQPTAGEQTDKQSGTARKGGVSTSHCYMKGQLVLQPLVGSLPAPCRLFLLTAI